MVTGIVLAGGKSERMGLNKLLLPIKGKAILLHTIDSIRPFVDQVIVVTGKYHNELANILHDVSIVKNNNYEKGMFSSVLAGVKEAKGDFFIIPGDCPFVSKEVYQSLLNSKDFSIRVPTYMGENGHPILFHEKMKDELLKQDINSNLKEFRNKVGYEVCSVTDQNILNDIDTLSSYEQFN